MKPGPDRARWALLLGALLVVALALQLAAGPWPGVGDPARVVQVDGAAIRVEIADDEAERARGLMHRTDLGPDAGMLFVYPEALPLSFWMKDTPLDLDIGFFDADGRLLNIEEMTAFDQTSRHWSQGPARYALETRRGWFAARGIQPGARLQLPPELRGP